MADLPDLSLGNFQRVSVARSAAWHEGQTSEWNGADWSNAMLGEIGETAEVVDALVAQSLMTLLTGAGGNAANTVKKLRRHETGTATPRDPSPEDLRGKLGSELADVTSYSVLLADHYDLWLPGHVISTFNNVSERQGFPEFRV